MRIARRATDFKPAMLTVCDGQICRGFILNRGRNGFEAFDAEQRSLGKYPTQDEAVRSIPAREVAQ